MATETGGASVGGRSMAPLRALVDTNVALDLLLGREPWVSQARPMWDARDASRLELYLSASTVTDIFYICRKQVGADRAKMAVAECLSRLNILMIDRTLLMAALSLSGSDFEDNVQIACAQVASLDLIVTRDIAGFTHAGLPVIAPSDIARYLPQP